MLTALLSLAIQAAIWIIIGGVLLEMVGRATAARWLYHPVIQAVVRAENAMCAPFRALMEAVGIPTRPLDFSPMLAIGALEVLGGLIVRIFSGI